MAVYYLNEAKSRPRQPKGSNRKEQKTDVQRGQPIGLSQVPQNYGIETTECFDKDAKHLHLTDNDISELKQVVKTRTARANIKGFTQKFDWTPKRMRSLGDGEYRTYCVRFIKGQKAYLCRIYAKNEHSDLDDKELKAVTDFAEVLNK